MKQLRWVAWIAIAGLAIGWLSGCSAESGDSGGGMNEAAAVESQAASAADMAYTEAKGAAAPEETATTAEQPAKQDASLPAGGEFSVAPDASPTQLNRMLIYKANLVMEVEDYGDAYTEIQNVIHLSGGYIVGFAEEASQYEKTGLFTVKVPAGGFSSFLSKLEQLPHVSLNRSMQAQDVSEEYVDLESRLKAKQVVEQRLLGFMEKASRTDDLVQFSNELARVQEEIERMKGRMRFLEQNVAYSTVELRVYEKVEGNPITLQSETKLGERMSQALKGSLDVLATVAEGVLVVVAGAIPIVAAVVVFGTPVYWVLARRRKRERNSTNENL